MTDDKPYDLYGELPAAWLVTLRVDRQGIANAKVKEKREAPADLPELANWARLDKAPRPGGLGLPCVGINLEWQREDGMWRCEWDYDGASDPQSLVFGDPSTTSYEIDCTLTTAPIESHPRFLEIVKKYGSAKQFDPKTEEFLGFVKKLPSYALADPSKGGAKSPLYGTEDWRVPAMTWRVCSSCADLPGDFRKISARSTSLVHSAGLRCPPSQVKRTGSKPSLARLGAEIFGLPRRSGWQVQGGFLITKICTARIEMSLLDLRLRRGDPWTFASWNRHLEEIDRLLHDLPLGRGKRSRRGGSQEPGPIYLAIRTDAGTSPGEWLVRVGQGYVGGIIPQIEGKRITDILPDTGDTPALTVHSGDFSGKPKNSGDWPEGTALIYARCTLDNPSWSLRRVEIIARATPWTVTPWQTARLIGALQRDTPADPASDVSTVQLTAFNQALTLSRKSPSGSARYWWRALP